MWTSWQFRRKAGTLKQSPRDSNNNYYSNKSFHPTDADHAKVVEAGMYPVCLLASSLSWTRVTWPDKARGGKNVGSRESSSCYDGSGPHDIGPHQATAWLSPTQLLSSQLIIILVMVIENQLGRLAANTILLAHKWERVVVISACSQQCFSFFSSSGRK